MEYNSKYVGKVIKEHRNKLRLTQVEAAEKIKVSESYYKSIETGQAVPSLAVFMSIINFYNISADSLLFPTPERENAYDAQIQRQLAQCSDDDLKLMSVLLSALLSHRESSAKEVDFVDKTTVAEQNN